MPTPLELANRGINTLSREELRIVANDSTSADRAFKNQREAADAALVRLGPETPEPIDPAEAIEAGEETGVRNIARTFLAVEPLATARAFERTEEFDQLLSDRFRANLESVLPDPEESLIAPLQESLERVEGLFGVADDLLSGELPQDTQDFIERTLAERNVSTGVFGPAAEFDLVQQLGLLSQEQVLRGVDLTRSLATESVPQLTSALLSTATALQPPTTDPIALSTFLTGQATGVGSVSPTAAMQTASTIALQNASQAWQQSLTQFSAQTDLFQTQLTLDAAQRAGSNSLLGSIAGAVGTVGGALVGGPAGAAIGGSVGGLVGGSSLLTTPSGAQGFGAGFSFA